MPEVMIFLEKQYYQKDTAYICDLTGKHAGGPGKGSRKAHIQSKKI